VPLFSRIAINGIIWILRSGARWQDLPKDFPSYQTCHRRFQQWVTDGTLRKILEVLARDLEERGEIDLKWSHKYRIVQRRRKGARARARFT